MIRSLRVLLCIAVLASCALAQTTLNGAGATFPYPIYSKWFNEYHNLHSDIEINYQSIGSGGGIRQVQAGTVDFGASDGPMTDQQMAESKVKVLHVPTVLGAVVPAYNIPGVSGEVKFTPEALAGIFLGKITKWNDKAITAANPGMNFPDQNITVAHRSDGSGTTYIFTDYLVQGEPGLARAAVGKGTSVKWPVGIGGKGNEGVAGSIRQLPGSIGYIELIYALAEQDSVRQRAEFFEEFHQGQLGVDHGGRGGSKDAGRLPGVDHQSSRQERLSYRQLHLAVGSDQSDGCQQGEDPEGLSLLDAGQGPDHDPGALLRSSAHTGGGDGKGRDHQTDQALARSQLAS